MNQAVDVQRDSVNPYRDIYEQYVDEASFLWVLRSVALDQPHYLPNDLRELEGRMDSHLDGLMTAPEDAWEVCRDALDFEEGGEVFAASVTAFRSLDVSKIQKAVEVGLTNDDTMDGLITALNWLPGKLCHPWIKKFFTSKDFRHKLVALKACSLRGENPADYLSNIIQREDCREDQALYAQALRSIGEFKRIDLIDSLKLACESESEEIVFWAAWSDILLGNKGSVEKLKSYALNDGPLQKEALQLAFRVLPVEQSREWISELARQPAHIRSVIKATEIFGDPHAVNWLILQMKDPSLARLAAEAFSTITGIDLEENQLATELPNLDQQIPNDDSDDDDVSLDEDENLPFPATEKIAAVWQKYGQHYTSGQRYFMGKPVNTETLKQQLAEGYQRRRHAAALELSLADIKTPLQNTRSKLQRQA